MGSMTLWQLARRGVSAVGIDQCGAPHDLGAHAGESRIFRVAYQEGEHYVPSLRRARELWLALQGEAGAQLFYPCGFLTAGTADSSLMKSTFDSIDRHGLPFESLSAAQLERRYPQLNLPSDAIGVIDKLGGIVAPEIAVAAAIDRGRELGAEVRLHTRVGSIVERSDGVAVKTEEGVERFDHVVLTAGAWTRGFDQLAHLPITAMRLYLAWFLTRNPQLFDPARFPGVVIKTDDMSDLQAGIALFPCLDGKTVKAGESLGGDDPSVSADELDRTMPQARIRRLSAAIESHVQLLRPDPIRVSVYVDGYTPDSRPIAHTTSRTTTLAGFSGHGFKFAPLIGEIAAETVTSGSMPTHASDLFTRAPSR
jgi:sarcosine oxidase